jgi:hypothetical protein
MLIFFMIPHPTCVPHLVWCCASSTHLVLNLSKPTHKHHSRKPFAQQFFLGNSMILEVPRIIGWLQPVTSSPPRSFEGRWVIVVRLEIGINCDFFYLEIKGEITILSSAAWYQTFMGRSMHIQWTT